MDYIERKPMRITLSIRDDRGKNHKVHIEVIAAIDNYGDVIGCPGGVDIITIDGRSVDTLDPDHVDAMAEWIEENYQGDIADSMADNMYNGNVAN